MIIRHSILTAASTISLLVLIPFAIAAEPSLKEQRAALIAQLKEVHGLTEAQTTAVARIIENSPVMGTGNPDTTHHPMSEQQCRDKVKAAGVTYGNSAFEKICGGKFMAPLYNPKSQKPEEAAACIDQFEFPDSPCSYPVVWVQAKEAAEICTAMGKRMCDAHEWEGGCDGALLEADYAFDQIKGVQGASAFNKLRRIHNSKFAASKKWAYGSSYQKGKCGANSTKDAGCNGGDWKRCGSNTYPSGAFPDCKSSLDVYDQHGNAAEHMNLPLDGSQMSSRGSKTLGYTEMKGSWFIFDKFHAHEDWCRWRAPDWHMTKVMDGHSHHNYHLGFRCCKTLGGAQTRANAL